MGGVGGVGERRRGESEKKTFVSSFVFLKSFFFAICCSIAKNKTIKSNQILPNDVSEPKGDQDTHTLKRLEDLEHEYVQLSLTYFWDVCVLGTGSYDIIHSRLILEPTFNNETYKKMIKLIALIETLNY